MINYLKNKFLLSDTGAGKMIKGIVFSAALNISFMMPIWLIYMFLNDTANIFFYKDQDAYSIPKYIILGAAVLILIYIVNTVQYDSVYTNTYNETAKKRIDISDRMRKMPISFFSKRDLSDLTTTIMRDMESMEHAYSHAVPQFYGTVISIIFITAGIAFMSPKIALALIWPFPIALLIIKIMENKKYAADKKHSDKKLEVTERIQETLENILHIKAYQRTEKTLKEFEKSLDEEENTHLKAEIFIPFLLGPLSSFMRLGLMTAAIAGFFEYSGGNIKFAQYITLIIASATIYLPMDSCLSYIIEFILIQIPVERMKDILQSDEIMTGEDIEVDSFNIEVENISFRYDEDKKVIDGVSFTAEQGQTTALVGPSGCGKSTLAKLMLRFWDVESGKIKLGGKDIKKADPESLLRYYSMVFQEVILFNNTIMENIRIGKKDATDEEVIRAAEIAQVDSFVKKLPDGYNTMIGENGALLSGGERQRISIARAVLKDSPIIFLDESTASIDASSETAIQKALSSLIKNKTVVIIAHRLRTVERADKIVVLDEGRVSECGTAEELIEKKGLFYKLWKTQKDE